MDIAWFRDLIIVIFGILGIVAAILFIVVTLKFYRKLRPIIDSARTTADTIKSTVALISDVITKFLTTAYGWVQGGHGALAIIAKLLRKRGEEE